MRISDWSSDVCSSDLLLNACLSLDPALLDSEQGESAYNAYTSKEFPPVLLARLRSRIRTSYMNATSEPVYSRFDGGGLAIGTARGGRSEEHTSELQSLMRISYAVFCLKKKKKK